MFIVVVLWLVLAVATVAAFVFQTAVVNLVWEPALVLAVAASAAVFLVAFGGLPSAGGMRAIGRRDSVLAALAGIAGIAVTPALVFASRATDVPPGAVVAFWTTAVWGALLIVSGALLARSPVLAAAAGLAVTGAMGVLGNWERPSSFSLLVRYPDRELMLLLAGVLLVVSVMVLVTLARRHRRAPVYLLAAIAGVVAAAGWALAQSGGDVAALALPQKAWPYVAAGGLGFALTVELARRAGMHVVGSAYVLAPSLLTGLLFVEEATRVFGPRPILVDPAGWATILALAAVTAVLTRSSSTETSASLRRTPSRVRLAGLAIAAASLALAGVALALPGIEVAVTGTLQEGGLFSARFTMEGFRTTGGWVALALALLASAVWIERPSRVRAYVAAAAGVVAAFAYPHIRFTPLHTWISWIPPAVQHDYGTEYANIVFEPVAVGAQVAAIAVACIALGAYAVYRTVAVAPDVRDGADSEPGGRI